MALKVPSLTYPEANTDLAEENIFFVIIVVLELILFQLMRGKSVVR